MKQNKKKIILSVIGILLLIVLMAGISYAMFIFTGTGSKENLITSGVLNINYEENSLISLSNQYPMSDTLGINNIEEGTTMSFDVVADIRGTATINYVIALDQISMGTTLTDEYVKIYLTKNDEVANGFTAGEGKLVSELKNNFVQDRIESYAVLTDSFSSGGSHHYKLKAWVADSYDLPTTDTNTGNTHSNTTSSESFSFKIKVIAIDQSLTILNDVTPPSIESIEITKINETAMNKKENKGIRFIANKELAVNNLNLKTNDKIAITVIYSERIKGAVPSLILKFDEQAAHGTITEGVINTNKIVYNYTINKNDGGNILVSFTGGNIVDLANNTANLNISSEITQSLNQISLYKILTINPNGGTFNNISTVTTYEMKNGETKDLSSINAASGYLFSKWLKDVGDGSINNSVFTMGHSDTTLTIEWLSILEMITYTGSSEITYDINGNWLIKLLSSGDLVFKNNNQVDIFAVGGGGGGASDNSLGGGGGAGGRTTTAKNVSITKNQIYQIVVGAGGTVNTSGSSSSALGVSANGGGSGSSSIGGSGGSGGGGGGSYSHSSGIGGSNGTSGGGGGNAWGDSSWGGSGQNSTTYSFGESTTTKFGGGILYAGGGSGGFHGTDSNGTCYSLQDSNGGLGGGGKGGSYSQLPTNGTANTGGGGGGAGGCDQAGAGSNASGGSGVILIRNTQ